MGQFTSSAVSNPRRLGPLFLWCHETWRLPFETGIQRVVRRMAYALAGNGIEVVPVGWDERTRLIKTLGPRAVPVTLALGCDAGRGGTIPWLLVPEITLGLAASDLDPVQLGRAYGFKTAALVHDLIPLKLSADYDAGFLARFRRYATMFAAADLVLTTTNYVADDLRMHLGEAGLPVPGIATVALPAQFAQKPRCSSTTPARAPGDPLDLLIVSTWEPRKNLPRLLRAIRQASPRSGAPINLTIVGRRGWFPAYDAEVETILADMPQVKVSGSISDDNLVALYASSHASVYPSIEEGFGLPIGESLWLATPCLCHSGSSMAEVAPGGGTLMIDMTDEAAIIAALLDLAQDASSLAQLSSEAIARPLASWSDYASKLASKLDLI